MAICVIFGGAGYIGTHMTKIFLTRRIFSRVYIADIKPSSLKEAVGVRTHIIDVRNEINLETGEPPDWIFNLAAIHREPGHHGAEYYETNIRGAENICAYAERVKCNNILFTSSISVYGPTLKPTSEYTLTMPNTPYGISKLTAEYIHKVWAHQQVERKLVCIRPGVIYGPGDPGNILRMIRAIRSGYFFLPVSAQIKKSYGYIFGLIDSVIFTMSSQEKIFVYNYVERETEALGQMIKIINETFFFKGRVIRIPFLFLRIVAFVIHKIRPNINGIHPERVKKVARPTHIIPQVLKEKNFKFEYDFKKSLIDWKERSPKDFEN